MRSDGHHQVVPCSRALCGTATWRGKAILTCVLSRVLREVRRFSIISKCSIGVGRDLIWEAQNQGDAWGATWQHELT